MGIMDHQPDIEEKRLEDVESLEESVKIVAARRLKRQLDSELKTAASEEPPTTKISANQKDVDLIKPKPQPQLRRKMREPTLKLNLDLLNKYPNSYFMDVRCQGAGCFFVGEFVVVNKHPLYDLTEMGLWYPTLKNQIIYEDCSVQKIYEIPDDLKAIYKPVGEIKQRTLVDMAVDRGCYIDRVKV